MNKLVLLAATLLTAIGMPLAAQTAKQLVEQGTTHFYNEEYTQAAECFRKAAEKGDAEGQDNYGGMFLYGTGVKQDYQEAMKWFRKSAAQGFSEGQRDVGYMYHHGLGVTQDFKEAYKWYSLAVQQNNAHAQTCMGHLYYNGLGVTKSLDLAKAWFLNAASNGDREAMNLLGVIAANEGKYTEAVKWYEKSSERNYWWGTYNLANCYRDGSGVKQDYAKAAELYRTAADQNVAEAQNELGKAYAYGHGVTTNYATAVHWFRKAAENGLSKAQFNMGRSYEGGIGVPKNIQTAQQWYQKAADQGNSEARDALAKLKSQKTSNENYVAKNTSSQKNDSRKPTGSGSSQYNHNNSTTKYEPKLEFENKKHDIGLVPYGKSVEYKCVFTNIGDTPVRIIDAGIKTPERNKITTITIVDTLVQPKSKGTIKIYIHNTKEYDSKGAEHYALAYINVGNNLAYYLNIKAVLLPKNGYISIKGDNSKYGALDAKGALVIPYEYDQAIVFHNEGLGLTKKNGKYGIVNSNNQVVIPFEYDREIIFDEEGIAHTQKNGKWGIIDKNNRIVTPFKHSTVYDRYRMSSSFIYRIEFTTGWKKTIIDANRRPILPEYDDIGGNMTSIQCGYICVKKNGKWGVVSRKNKILIPLIYESIGDIYVMRFYKDQLFIAKKNGKYGVIDSKNKTIIPFEYEALEEKVSNLEEGAGAFWAKKNGRWGAIHWDNSIAEPFNQVEDPRPYIDYGF